MQNINEITEGLNQPEKWQKTLDNVLNLDGTCQAFGTTVDATIRKFSQLSNRAQNLGQQWIKL